MVLQECSVECTELQENQQLWMQKENLEMQLQKEKDNSQYLGTLSKVQCQALRDEHGRYKPRCVAPWKWRAKRSGGGSRTSSTTRQPRKELWELNRGRL